MFVPAWNDSVLYPNNLLICPVPLPVCCAIAVWLRSATAVCVCMLLMVLLLDWLNYVCCLQRYERCRLFSSIQCVSVTWRSQAAHAQLPLIAG